MRKNILAIGIVFLFILSALTPITFGYNVKILNLKEQKPINYCYGNPPDEQWNRTFGGSNADNGHAVQQTNDGGYVIAGTTKSLGDTRGDFWLIKTDDLGIEQWNKTYGGIYGDFANSVLQTSDGGYILLGETSSFGAGDYDFWLVKTDSYGAEQWNKTYGGSDRDNEGILRQTDDGGYLLIGSTSSFGNGYSDYWLVKTDGNGNEEWNKTYGGFDLEKAWAGQVTSDGGIIIAGYTGYPYVQILLIKTDMYGNEEWSKTYGDINFSTVAFSLQETNDNGFIISGIGCSNGTCNLLLVKTDIDGEEQWNKTFEGEACFDSIGYSVKQTLDGGFIATGTTEIIGDFYISALLVKTDNNGNLQWYKIFNRTLNSRGWAVNQTNDKGYIIVGETDFHGVKSGDVWLIKVEKEKQPPNPPIIKGPTRGTVGIAYNYTFLTIDPYGDILYYDIYWGDGNVVDWFGPFASGEEVTLKHAWSEKGIYTIKARAKNSYGVSDWGTLVVTMPRNRATYNSLFLRFLEQFPILQKILCYIL